MKVFPVNRLTRLALEAREHERGRVNLNIHEDLADPVQRFFNAMEPGTYVRPHRHAPGRWELFVALMGRAVVLSFDQVGAVTARTEISPEGPAAAVEIEGGAWHTVAALAAGTVVLEVKPGPYHPIEDKDFAPWAPPEGKPGTAAVERWYHTADVHQRLPRY